MNQTESDIIKATKNLVAVCKMIGLSDLKEVIEAEKLINDMRSNVNDENK